LILRLQFPRWGKDKLAVLLDQKLTVSTSMVGRILTQLKRSGQLIEPPRPCHTAPAIPGSRRPLRPRPYTVRKPKQYAVSRPGDLVQVDTLDVRPVPGVVFKQFTARDVVSRWDVIQAHGRATAYAASQVLETLLHRMPNFVELDFGKIVSGLLLNLDAAECRGGLVGNPPRRLAEIEEATNVLLLLLGSQLAVTPGASPFSQTMKIQIDQKIDAVLTAPV